MGEVEEMKRLAYIEREKVINSLPPAVRRMRKAECVIDWCVPSRSRHEYFTDYLQKHLLGFTKPKSIDMVDKVVKTSARPTTSGITNLFKAFASHLSSWGLTEGFSIESLYDVNGEVNYTKRKVETDNSVQGSNPMTRASISKQASSKGVEDSIPSSPKSCLKTSVDSRPSSFMEPKQLRKKGNKDVDEMGIRMVSSGNLGLDTPEASLDEVEFSTFKDSGIRTSQPRHSVRFDEKLFARFDDGTVKSTKDLRSNMSGAQDSFSSWNGDDLTYEGTYHAPGLAQGKRRSDREHRTRFTPC